MNFILVRTLMAAGLAVSMVQVAAAQNNNTGGSPSGGGLGQAGATSLGTDMSVTGAGNVPGGGSSTAPQNNAAQSGSLSRKGDGDNTPGTGGARGSTGVDAGNP